MLKLEKPMFLLMLKSTGAKAVNSLNLVTENLMVTHNGTGGGGRSVMDTFIHTYIFLYELL